MGIIELIILVIPPLALLTYLGYSLRRGIFTLRQWGIVLLSGIVWSIGGLLGAVLVGDAWDTLIEKLYDGYSMYDIINYEVGVPGYYSLALSGILAALLGVGALYLLLRYFPAQGKK